MQIVKLNVEDVDKIYDLLYSQFGNEAWNKIQILESFSSGSTSFYGIILNNNLLCVASILQTVDDINLLDIATRQDYKRKGLARKLLSYLIGLKGQNQTFSLEVKSKNEPAINLYKSLGFKVLNIRKRYYKDGDDALCMFLN